MISLGCGPELRTETEWVQWFAYRDIAGMAVTSEGDAVVVGRSTNDERVTGAPYGQYTWRPWMARLADDGTVLDSWTGFLGRADAVAVDDLGRAYVVLSGLRDDSDWNLPTRCELRALEVDGSIRWTQRWGEDQSAPCPRDVVVAADAVVVRVDEHLEAYELGGDLRWQIDLPTGIGSSRLSAHADEIWLAHDRVEDETVVPVAWRIDAHDGSTAEIELELGELRPGRLEVTDEGIFTVAYLQPDPLAIPVEGALVSLTHTGKRRWMDPEPQPVTDLTSRPEWRAVGQWVVAEGTTPWVIGTEKIFGDQDPGERYRIAVQRRTSRGEREGTIRRSFVEADPAEPDEADPARRTCPSSDVLRPPQLGSRAASAVVGAEDSLLLAGHQGCRDSFLMRLQVQR